MRINWRTVGNIIDRVETIKNKEPEKKLDGLAEIGIDETSYKKGHSYLLIIVNHANSEVVYAAKGDSRKALEPFFKSLSPEQLSSIRLVSGDGARWIKSTVLEYMPWAEFCIDPFHVVTWAVEAMDVMRRRIWRELLDKEKEEPKRGRGRPKKQEEPGLKGSKLLKNSKYALGKNPENLTEKQMENLEYIMTVYPKLFRGYQLKEGLRQVFNCGEEEVECNLKKWLSWACRSRIPEFVELSKKIRRHCSFILNTRKNRISNARIEALNNKIKLIIRRSYGFRNIESLMSMIKLVCSETGRNLRPAYSYDPDFE